MTSVLQLENERTETFICLLACLELIEMRPEERDKWIARMQEIRREYQARYE